MRPGDAVRLVVPDNPRLDGAAATVEALEEWGAFVRTAAAATGRFRALWSEMLPQGPVERNGTVREARERGMTGDLCDRCGGCNVVRSGTCALCLDCGSTSGCG
jgi:hypothetical protein